MAHRTVTPVTSTCAAAIAIAAVALAGCGSGSSSSATPASVPAPAAATTGAPAAASASSTGPATVAVTLSEYKIATAAPSAPAGRVRFMVTNSGKLKHQFTIIRTSKPAAEVLSKHEPNDDIAGARGEIASLAPGRSKTLLIKKLKAGHYALVCALPGHYQSGMYADFTVG